MEAATLQKKKNAINKGKLKKTIKNVLCRPDPVFWPLVSEDEGKLLEQVLNNHKINIPEFKKSHWKELKSIPKDQRPKPPKVDKVPGLLFGISECSAAIQSGQCSAVIIDSAVNPQAIVRPLLESCLNSDVPVVCISGLRKLSVASFYIKTSCLGIKREHLQDISEKVKELAEKLVPKEVNINKMVTEQNDSVNEIQIEEKTKTVEDMETQDSTPECIYLYRTNKNARVFIPPTKEHTVKSKKQFIGQDFIEFSHTTDKQATSKKFMKMMVKRITNNPNRVKRK